MIKVYITPDEAYPYFYLYTNSDMKDCFKPNAELTEEEFEDYSETMKRFSEWQDKLRSKIEK